MIEGQEIREITQVNDYVALSLPRFEELIRADERHKVETEKQAIIDETKHSKEYWYREYNKIEEERNELRKALDDAKAQIVEMLGIKELELVKLSEMQFEKGVTNDTDTSGC